MSENRRKSSRLTEGLAPSEKRKDWRKAIFAIREIFQEHVYQTRGMACAIYVSDSIRLVTWRGVADHCNNVAMDRFSKKFFKDVQKYRLQKSTVTTCGSFSFLSVSYNDNFAILQSKVPGNKIKVSNLTAYSFLGEETIDLEFKYNKTKKQHELITTGGEWEKRVTEKTSILGSPIIDEDRAVVGVVGESDDGKIVPVFITEKEFDQVNKKQLVKNTEEDDEEEEKEEEDTLFVLEDDQRDQMESAKNTSSQKELNSSSKDVPDAKIVRRGAIPIHYLPYLALDIQSSNVGWTSLGRALGVDGAYLSGISKDHDEDYECYYKMLKHWHQQSSSATYDELAKALKEVYLWDIATKYCFEGNDPPTKESQKISGLKAARVSERDLLGICRAVEGRRKRLGRALGVPDEEIDKIVEQNRSDVSEQSYQILQKWVQMKGKEATYDALAQALLDRSVMMKAVMEECCLDPETKQKNNIVAVSNITRRVYKETK